MLRLVGQAARPHRYVLVFALVTGSAACGDEGEESLLAQQESETEEGEAGPSPTAPQVRTGEHHAVTTAAGSAESTNYRLTFQVGSGVQPASAGDRRLRGTLGAQSTSGAGQ